MHCQISTEPKKKRTLKCHHFFSAVSERQKICRLMLLQCTLIKWINLISYLLVLANYQYSNCQWKRCIATLTCIDSPPLLEKAFKEVPYYKHGTHSCTKCSCFELSLKQSSLITEQKYTLQQVLLHQKVFYVIKSAGISPLKSFSSCLQQVI